ncbi:MAG: PilN domain-containing protein [Methylococcaceae bacterium]|nr:PilN domain-containing protein [Methylococcaceae bacterium]
MIKLDTPIEVDVRGFFRWWLAELSATVPPWLRKMVTESYDYLLVTAHGEHFQVSLVTEEPGKEFGRILLNEEGREVWYRLVSRNPELQKAQIVLRLEAGQALVKMVTLPSAAESNRYQVVGFEMERLTPFKVDQVYYDVRLVEKLPDLNQIKVELVLVPRKNLDAMLKRMVGLGLLPGRVDVATSDEKDRKKPQLRYNLLPQKLHDKPNNRKRLINGSLLLLLAILLGLTGALPLWMKHNYMLELEAEVERESKVANEVQTLKQDADRLLREADFLLKKKSSEPVMVEILSELTTRLRDDTWLEHINYRNPNLQIHGQSPSASALIEILEASPIFKDTSFVSPVSQDRNTGLERFQIATLVLHEQGNDQRSE